MFAMNLSMDMDQNAPTSVITGNTTYVLGGNATHDLLGNSTPQGLDDHQMLKIFVHHMNIIGTPIIIIVGVIGNFLSALVFTCSHLRYQSMSVYLAFMNCVDIGFLLSLLLAWFGFVRINIIHRQFWCQLVVYATYVFSFLSPWAVVSFTCERYIVVFMPLKKQFICTRKYARIAVCSLSFAALLLYSFALWTSRLRRLGSFRICTPLPKYFTLLKVATTMDTVLTLVVPSLLIIVLNAKIGCKICRFFASQRAMTAGYSEGSNNKDDTTTVKTNAVYNNKEENSAHSVSLQVARSGGGLRRHSFHIATRRNFQLKTTRSLLLISTTFVILNLPSHVYRLYTATMEMVDDLYMHDTPGMLYQQLLQFVYYINFASNFFIYNACSRTFRKALRRIFHRLRYNYTSGLGRGIQCCHPQIILRKFRRPPPVSV